MSLTAGRGPFAKKPAGRFNFDPDPPGAALFWDPVPYRLRAFVDGDAVFETRRARLLHETGRLPVYYVPLDDFRSELLVRTQRTTHCPYKGAASYWTIRSGDREVPDAVWAYEQPIESASFLAGFASLDWHAADEWFVEDEQVFGHPRDPYHRIDVYETTRHVRISIGGELVADSRRARALFETGLPPRWYLPREDVREQLLEPSATKTRCAYKGSASYWHVRAGGDLHEDVVWSYPDPQHDAEPVRDLLCFFDERVEVELDGERAERPETQWSR